MTDIKGGELVTRLQKPKYNKGERKNYKKTQALKMSKAKSRNNKRRNCPKGGR